MCKKNIEGDFTCCNYLHENQVLFINAFQEYVKYVSSGKVVVWGTFVL
jgi:hypothetical protein